MDAQGRYDAAIYAVGGTSLSDLTLAGLNGRVIHYDGRSLRDVEAPTASSLTSVVTDGPDLLMAGAHRGSVILLGHPDRGFARLLDVPNTQVWAYRLLVIDGVILVADPTEETGGVWTLTPDGLERHPEVTDPVIALDRSGGTT